MKLYRFYAVDIDMGLQITQELQSKFENGNVFAFFICVLFCGLFKLVGLFMGVSCPL